MAADGASAYELLQSLLQPPAPSSSRLRRWLPCSGTLPQWLAPELPPQRRRWRPWLSALRSLAQVIFINNPISGAVLLLAFLLESPWMALLALVGTLAAHLSSRGLSLQPTLRHQGIYGFNGTLVGCAVAALRPAGSAASAAFWLMLVALGGAVTPLLLEGWRRRFAGCGSPPPLTLPFILVSWLLLASAPPAALTAVATAAAASGGQGGPVAVMHTLALGLPHSFGQVFLCSRLISGVLVLLATALASPLAAALGLLGALAAMVVAFFQGADAASLSQGLWGYNGVLVAIALGGIFFAPGLRSLLLALAGGALSVPVLQLQALLLPGLPRLTLAFVLTTWLLQRAARRLLPALIPVSLHALVTPEEHRERHQVARQELGAFRRNLRGRAEGLSTAAAIALPPLPLSPEQQQIAQLFRRLDRSGDGLLSVAELREALGATSSAGGPGSLPPAATERQLNAILAAMDLDGDGRLNPAEFAALILRLQRLRHGEERLLLYLMPADGDGNDQLDAEELQRLLRSIGQPPLTPSERGIVFGADGAALPWSRFIDRLLLT